ncbi:hypothetical protein [Mycoplasma sp. 480]|uniref:hypothetical protein n=1 Tax=Mycoplasma sp. 480 TaxID=3440155 RepID=UPI003F512B3E
MKKIKLLLPVLTTISISSFLVSCHENKENIQKKDNESKFIFEKPAHNKYHNPDELFKEWNQVKYKKDFLEKDNVWEVHNNHIDTFYFANPYTQQNEKQNFNLSPFVKEDKKEIFNFDLNHLGQFIAISNIDQFNFFMNDLRTSFFLKTTTAPANIALIFYDENLDKNIKTNNPFYLMKERLLNKIIKINDGESEENIKNKLKKYFETKILIFSLFIDDRDGVKEYVKQVNIKFPKTNNLKDLVQLNLKNKSNGQYIPKNNLPLTFEFHELDKENSKGK